MQLGRVFLVLALAAVLANGQNAAPLPIQSWSGKRVLMVSAHPDDIEAGAGGTIAQLTAQGTQVGYVIFTNGDKGCSNAICQNSTREQIASIRYQEALNAAQSLGVRAQDVFLLDYEDSMLPSYPWDELRQRLVAIIRRFQPFVMMSWFPYPNFNLLPSAGWSDLGYHVDHQQAGKIAMDSISAAGLSRLYDYTGLPPWSISQFYFWDFLAPTHYVDIGKTLNNKIAAFQQHKSQVPDPSVVVGMMTQLANRVANNTAGFSGQYAEGFKQWY